MIDHDPDLVARDQRDRPISEIHTLIAQLHDTIRKKDEAKPDAWIANAKAAESHLSLRASSRTSLRSDAVTQPWSNGQVEGSITKLKFVKRQNSRRAKLYLLEARLLSPRDPATLLSNMRRARMLNGLRNIPRITRVGES
ncbi:transposase [Tardiphaga sp. vice352]|nr:transposase [Tardiphaga sp. vice278]QDM24963.1 transposase [Tardiphaga sp. vice304]QDM30171.1 transposase [Tardiphaga sp. vice352]